MTSDVTKELDEAVQNYKEKTQLFAMNLCVAALGVVFLALGKYTDTTWLNNTGLIVYAVSSVRLTIQLIRIHLAGRRYEQAVNDLFDNDSLA
jgi:hypothetical protein